MADSSNAAVRVRDQYPLVLLIRRGAIRMPAPEGYYHRRDGRFWLRCVTTEGEGRDRKEIDSRWQQLAN